jgi:hypothetical protein
MAANKRKLIAALICYGVLILAALYLLLPVRSSNESFMLVALLLFFGFLIVKTIAHSNDSD